ncbi:hypothetical protein AAY473_001454 [Plecturocebus cupreus]
MPIIPALWEAKAGGSAELFGRLRQENHLNLGGGECIEPRSRHCTPAWPPVWWHVRVVPATQEAEAGELLEPGRQRLQWAEITSLHSSLGDRVKRCLKNKKLKKARPNLGQVQCLTPIIPALWEAEVDRESPGGEATRVASATLLAGAAVLPAPSAELPGAECAGRTGSAGPIPTRKTAIGSAEDGEFHSGRSEPGKVWLCGEGASAKGKLRNRKTSSPGGERSKMAT